MLSKEEIENMEKDIKIYIHDWMSESTDEDGYEKYPIDDYSMDFINNVDNLLQYIDQLEQENNKLNKMIEEQLKLKKLNFLKSKNKEKKRKY